MANIDDDQIDDSDWGNTDDFSNIANNPDLQEAVENLSEEELSDLGNYSESGEEEDTDLGSESESPKTEIGAEEERTGKPMPESSLVRPFYTTPHEGQIARDLDKEKQRKRRFMRGSVQAYRDLGLARGKKGGFYGLPGETAMAGLAGLEQGGLRKGVRAAGAYYAGSRAKKWALKKGLSEAGASSLGGAAAAAMAGGSPSDIMRGAASWAFYQRRLKRLRTIWRAVNLGAGLTVVGLIIPFISMNLQLFWGNILHLKWIPPLTIIELVIIGVVDLLIWLLFILVVVLLYFMIIINCSGPGGELFCGAAGWIFLRVAQFFMNLF